MNRDHIRTEFEDVDVWRLEFGGAGSGGVRDVWSLWSSTGHLPLLWKVGTLHFEGPIKTKKRLPSS
jgi:hypothetical protein